MDLASYALTKKAIVFDMDGTLLDTEPQHIKAWNYVAKDYGFRSFDEEIINTIGGIPTLGIAKKIVIEQNLDADPNDICEAKTRAYRELFLPKATIFEDIAKILYKARELGIKTALATGSYEREVYILLEKFNLTQYFDAVITSDFIKRPKPNPDIYLLALEKLGVEPQDAIVFEDTQIGIQGVCAANIECIQVKNGQIVRGPIRQAH